MSNYPPNVPPPYPPQGQSPQSPGYPAAPVLQYATPVMAALNLRQVAVQQRAIQWCILGYIVCIVLFVAMQHSDLQLIFRIALLAVGITAAVFVFKLAITLYGTGGGIALGVLTLVPLVGILILLMVNGKATTTLRAAGIRVGLMGADMTQFPPQ